MLAPKTIRRRVVLIRRKPAPSALQMTGLGFSLSDLNPINAMKTMYDVTVDVLDDIPIVGKAVKFVDRVGAKGRRTLAKGARAVGLGPVIDKLEQWGGDLEDWTDKEIAGILKDPTTWMIVAGAAGAVFTGGASLAAATAAASTALTARHAPRIVDHATKDGIKKAVKEAKSGLKLSPGTGKAKVKVVREYNPATFDKRTTTLNAKLLESQMFKQQWAVESAKAAPKVVTETQAEMGLAPKESGLRKVAVEAVTTAFTNGATRDEAVKQAQRAVAVQRQRTLTEARAGAERYDSPEHRARYVAKYTSAVLVDGQPAAEADMAARRSTMFDTAPSDGEFYATELRFQAQQQAARPVKPKAAPSATSTYGRAVRLSAENKRKQNAKAISQKSNENSGVSTGAVLVGLAAVAAVGYVVYKRQRKVV